MTQRVHRLDPLLAPNSLALVGASPRPDTPGNNMVTMPRLAGWQGRLYPINPNYDAVEGLVCYPSLAALPERVEHVVLGVANARLESALEDAIAHGAKAVTIFASGILEGEGGGALAQRIGARARQAGLALCGGNGMGFYNLDQKLRVVAFSSALDMRKGSIAFIAQSGSAFGALSHNDRRLGFNLSVSSGGEWATSAADYLDWALEQETTGVVGLFLETVRDPSAFVAGLEKAILRRIPVVVLKVGRTPESAAMAVSHTGAIAGSDAAYEALFESYGVIRVDDEDEFAATLLLLSHKKRPASGGLAAMHDSGGERELMIDINAGIGTPFARISPKTQERLAATLDPGLQPINPLDAWGTGANTVANFTELMSALVDDSDTAMGVLFADIRDGYYLSEQYAQAMIAAAAMTEKPIAVAVNYSLVRHEHIALRLTESGVPVLDGTVEALKAMKHAFAFRDFCSRQSIAGETPASRDARAYWLERLASGPMTESDCLDLLDAYGIATPTRRRTTNLAETLRAGEAIGYPVVLKTAEPGILHKSDVDGVCVGLNDAAALAAAYQDLAARLGPSVLVQAMLGKGVEAALGAVNNADFGPYVMIAAGGVLIELLDDRAIALAPVSVEKANAMIDRLKLARLLAGLRGAKPADRAALADALRRLSHLAFDLRQNLLEIDVNPVIVSPRGAVAVDALVVGRDIARKGGGMDLKLSPAEAAIQKRSRLLFEEALAPLENLVAEHGHLPVECREALRRAVIERGFTGINHARKDGGCGFSIVEQMLINEQLGRASCGLWAAVWQPPIPLRYGTEEQKESYLRPSCRGDRRGCFAITEPGAGSDPRKVQTRAVLREGQWRISGEKWFVTSWDACDYVIVHAHVDGDPDKPTLFLIDHGAAGLRHVRSPRFMHDYIFDHAELVFDDVIVPPNRMLGEIGQGLELTKDWFVEARLQIAAHCIGAATRAAELAEAYAKERIQFGRPIREFQAVEFMIADMAVEIMAAKSTLMRVAWEIDAGIDRKEVHARASAVKLLASEMAGRVLDRAVQILGGRGYMRENAVERLYRDVRVDRIWEGTSEIQRAVIGGQIVKRGLGVYAGWPGERL
jgi:acetate---CoA ligase (ADP-forming)